MEKMAEKSKAKTKETPTKGKNQDDVISCAACSILLAKKDASKHKIWCTATNDDQRIGSTEASIFSQPIPDKARHGFIFQNRLLFGKVIRDVDASKELLNLPCTRLRECLLFLNPLSMRDLRLKIGDHVVLLGSAGTSNFAAAVWPSSKIPLLSIGIPRTSSNLWTFLDGYIAIQKIGRLKRARLVRLIQRQASPSVPNVEGFTKMCNLYLNGTCLKNPEDDVRIPYFGQIYSCQVVSTADDCEKIEFDQSNYSLSENFAALDVSASDSSFNESAPISSPCQRDLRNGTPSIVSDSDSVTYLPPISNEDFLLVDDFTEITLDSATVANYRPKLSYNDLGGMTRTKEILRDHVSACFGHWISNDLTLKTILLYGAPGCGKTSLAEAVAAECDANFLRVDLPSTELEEDRESGEKRRFDLLRRLVEENSPCVVLVDDIDCLSEKCKRSLDSLNSWIENFSSSSSRVCLIGATSAVERLNANLRKRYQFEIEIPVPAATDRKSILTRMLDRFDGISEIEIDSLVDRTHGFTPSDLRTLLKEALVISSKSIAGKPSKLGIKDLQTALSNVRPSAMREIFVEVPKVRWLDVGGNEDVKLKLQQTVEWPLRYPDRFAYLGIKPPTGILMYGPPGCSKTMIAKALATESGLNFLSVKGPELFSKWVGESERAVRDLFRKARQVAPSVIFFDEIDAIGSERSSSGSSGSHVNERVLAQMLTELDGVQPLTNVTVVAATNRPDVIDRALLRPGRLDFSIYVQLPDQNTREQILKLELGKKRIDDDVDVSKLVLRTEKYTGAELVALCNEAGLLALSEDRSIEAISMRHFDQALTTVKPRILDESLRIYDQFEKSIAT